MTKTSAWEKINLDPTKISLLTGVNTQTLRAWEESYLAEKNLGQGSSWSEGFLGPQIMKSVFVELFGLIDSGYKQEKID